MAKVAPYHTDTEEYEPNRNVHHRHDDCPDGKRIKRENRQSGDAGKPLCKECKKLG